MSSSTSYDRSDDQDIGFTHDDFQRIARLAKERFGLDLQESKKPLVQSRLTKRIRSLGLPSFSAYCDQLNKETGGAEIKHVLSALTTNVTHFFREPHHFEFIQSVLVPEFIAKCQAGRPVRAWSAACSSGQEAYSLAGSMMATNASIFKMNLKILATDIDPNVIAAARKGTYASNLSDQIPADVKEHLVHPSLHAGTFEVPATTRELIHFAQLNLMDEWPMRGKFDLIMCRNAAIYFDKPTQARLWERFADTLTDDGCLMIGHSERLTGPAVERFRNVGVTTYRRMKP